MINKRGFVIFGTCSCSPGVPIHTHWSEGTLLQMKPHLSMGFSSELQPQPQRVPWTAWNCHQTGNGSKSRLLLLKNPPIINVKDSCMLWEIPRLQGFPSTPDTELGLAKPNLGMTSLVFSRWGKANAFLSFSYFLLLLLLFPHIPSTISFYPFLYFL